MSTKARLALTGILGAVSALAFYAEWNGETETAFAHDLAYEILFAAVTIGVPLLVGRWWIAVAIVGPLGFLVIWQVTGHHVYADGDARPLNIESVAAMFWYISSWEIATAARKGWDAWRTRRARRSKQAAPGTS